MKGKNDGGLKVNDVGMRNRIIERQRSQIAALKGEVQTLHSTVVAITGKTDWAVPPSMDPKFSKDWD